MKCLCVEILRKVSNMDFLKIDAVWREAIDRFMQQAITNRAVTGSNEREVQYIIWLLDEEYKKEEGKFVEEHIDSLFKKYCEGDYRVEEFKRLHPVVDLDTVIKLYDEDGNKEYTVSEKPRGTVEYKDGVYVLLARPELDCKYTDVNKKDVYYYRAPAIALYDPINVDELGLWVKQYTVTWKMQNDFNPNTIKNLSNVVDMGELYRVENKYAEFGLFGAFEDPTNPKNNGLCRIISLKKQ